MNGYAMTAATLLREPAMIPAVTESTGQRVRRLRRELGLTQVELAQAAGVSESTIYLIESDRPGRRGSRLSTDDVLAALERERARRQNEPRVEGGPDLRLVSALLEGATPEDARVRLIGPRKKVRYLTVVARDPDVTDEEYAQAIEELHRKERGEI